MFNEMVGVRFQVAILRAIPSYHSGHDARKAALFILSKPFGASPRAVVTSPNINAPVKENQRTVLFKVRLSNNKKQDTNQSIL